jgi:threonine aldolase
MIMVHSPQANHLKNHEPAMNFTSDNITGASEKVLAAILAANAGIATPYGRDAVTLRVNTALDAFFGRKVTAFLLTTGTAANALACAAICPPWGTLLTHQESHVMEDECGAPEFFMHGAKITGLPGTGGKIAPETLRAYLDGDAQGANRPPVRALSISNGTEFGQVYHPAEVAALTTVAHAHGMKVHMDGARFSNALVTLGCTPAEITWQAGVDVLSLGGTKNGCLMAEAVIFFDEALAQDFIFRRKRGGQTLSKARLIAAQFEAFFDQDHWRYLASHANTMALRLADGLKNIPGLRLGWPCEINEVFLILAQQQAEALRAKGALFYEWSGHSLAPDNALREGETIIRLVTSFETKSEDVDAFIASVQTC